MRDGMHGNLRDDISIEMQSRDVSYSVCLITKR